MSDRLPIKRMVARLEKLEKKYAREPQELTENGETVVDLDKHRARMIAQGKHVRATNSSVTSPDNV